MVVSLLIASIVPVDDIKHKRIIATNSATNRTIDVSLFILNENIALEPLSRCNYRRIAARRQYKHSTVNR